MVKLPGDGTANLALLPWSRGGGFGGLSASESAGSLAAACRSSCGRERLDPEFAQGPAVLGSRDCPGAEPPSHAGVAGGSPGSLGCCFAAPGPFLCPSIFSQDFLVVPAARDVLVSEISRRTDCRGHRVLGDPRGLAASRIWDGSRVVLRAKCVTQLLGSKSKGNWAAEAKEKFPQAVSGWALPLSLCSEAGTRARVLTGQTGVWGPQPV